MTMLFHVLSAERLKLRRSPIWIPFLILTLIPTFMGTANYLQALTILTPGWYSLWSQVTLFYCYFFLPSLIGVFCAYLCRLEHLNRNWNAVLAAPIPLAHLYFSKLFIVTSMIALTQLFIGILFYLAGKLIGITEPFPLEVFSWLLLGTLAGCAIAAVLLTVSLLLRSFALPVGIALLSGIAGLLLSAKGFGHLSPFSLMCLGMNSNRPDGPLQIQLWMFMACMFFYLVLASGIGILWMYKTDVRTG